MIKIIYLDMDGVLADFVGGFESKFNTKLTQKSVDKVFKEKLSNSDFFETLPLMSKAKQLVKEVSKLGVDIEILTATGSTNSKKIADQKSKWVKNHFPQLKFNWVDKAVAKVKYSKKDTLLIDDRNKSLEPFIKAGGQGVLYSEKNFKKVIKEIKDKLIMNEKMKSYEEYFYSQEQLNEVLITFGNKAFPKFNNVVILSGGAGSGKGFVNSKLLGIEGKVLDVDALKKLAIDSTIFAAKVKEQTGVDLKNLDLKKPDDVIVAHEILSDLFSVGKKRENVLMKSIFAANPERKPNLIFDVTLKDTAKLAKIGNFLEKAGYEKQNIHIVWVINDIKIAIQQNKNRKRVVPDEILLTTHRGASLTMNQILDMGDDLKKYLDGDIWFSFNKVNVDTKLEKSDKGGSFIKQANIFKIKKRGSKPIKVDQLEQKIVDKIVKYTPKTQTWEFNK